MYTRCAVTYAECVCTCTCAAGTRYVNGAVLRLVRSFPDDWVVHVISADGTTQVDGQCFP